MAENAKQYSKETVVEIISFVQSRLAEKDLPELENMKQVLAEVKSILMLLKSEFDSKSQGIPQSSSELVTAVNEAEAATSKIIDLTMDIQSMVSDSGNDVLNKKVEKKTSEILEACSFQDITGQRINKVVDYIQTIDKDIDKLFGFLINAEEETQPPPSESSDKSLMNGPQLPGSAMSQSEIDDLLDQF